ncbi:hypothetical protein COCNU_04G007850 [Cocos nucifera]|uniref:Uncharacterized protein n=1 Tax=Cocos nucifera TaxID=13894 RepID=A0A8K0N0Q2_COCNU|nr:hypothetical protein COCNU_04G007850 [Cocos nucifera]
MRVEAAIHQHAVVVSLTLPKWSIRKSKRNMTILNSKPSNLRETPAGKKKDLTTLQLPWLGKIVGANYFSKIYHNISH